MHVAKTVPPGRAMGKPSHALCPPSPKSEGEGQPVGQAGDSMVAKTSLGTPQLTHLAGSWLGGRALGAGDKGERAEGAGEAGRAQRAGRAVGAVCPRGADGY